jgi:hypothetical protein
MGLLLCDDILKPLIGMIIRPFLGQHQHHQHHQHRHEHYDHDGYKRHVSDSPLIHFFPNGSDNVKDELVEIMSKTLVHVQASDPKVGMEIKYVKFGDNKLVNSVFFKDRHGPLKQMHLRQGTNNITTNDIVADMIVSFLDDLKNKSNCDECNKFIDSGTKFCLDCEYMINLQSDEKDKMQDNCAICLEPLTENVVTKFNCNHMLHMKCYKQLKYTNSVFVFRNFDCEQRKIKCPFCRRFSERASV